MNLKFPLRGPLAHWPTWWRLVCISVLAYLVEWAFPAMTASMVAILCGMAYRYWRPNQSGQAKPISGWLLKMGIVLLGFGLSFAQLDRIGLHVYLVLIPVVLVALLGAHFLGRGLSIPSTAALLVGMGSAICGGSAIAAAAPIVEADEEDIAFSITTIFLYNTLALFLFPLLGKGLHYTDQSFGLLAGAAINDTSSVVAAAFAYSDAAGTIATIVKMARTLLIVPICLGFLYRRYRQGRQAGEVFQLQQIKGIFPTFILYFLLAVLVTSLLPLPHWLLAGFKFLARLSMVMALAGVGLAVDIRQLRTAGRQSIILGGLCWILVLITAGICIQLFY